MVIKLQGEVAMRKNDVLSKRDLEQGYVLLCQSIPLSDDVWVDCDV
jgi:3-ketosteroid 9alpha-monooxygenase subunit B